MAVSSQFNLLMIRCKCRAFTSLCQATFHSRRSVKAGSLWAEECRPIFSCPPMPKILRQTSSIPREDSLRAKTEVCIINKSTVKFSGEKIWLVTRGSLHPPFPNKEAQAWVNSKLLKCAPAGCFSTMRPRPCPPCKYNKSVRNEKGIGGEMCLAIVSGMVTGDVSVSYWPVFSSVPFESPRTVKGLKPGVISKVGWVWSSGWT